jgi:hypothetical protein
VDLPAPELDFSLFSSGSLEEGELGEGQAVNLRGGLVGAVVGGLHAGFLADSELGGSLATMPPSLHDLPFGLC